MPASKAILRHAPCTIPNHRGAIRKTTGFPGGKIRRLCSPHTSISRHFDKKAEKTASTRFLEQKRRNRLVCGGLGGGDQPAGDDARSITGFRAAALQLFGKNVLSRSAKFIPSGVIAGPVFAPSSRRARQALGEWFCFVDRVRPLQYGAKWPDIDAPDRIQFQHRL
jgi:hypothetical protein